MLHLNLHRLTIENLKHIVAKTQDEELMKIARKELAKRLWNLRAFKKVV